MYPLPIYARLDPEGDLANVFERLIRREKLHEGAGPHVSVELRQGAQTQITRAARSRGSTIDNIDGLVRDRPAVSPSRGTVQRPPPA